MNREMAVDRATGRSVVFGQPVIFGVMIMAAFALLFGCLLLGYLFSMLDREMSANRELMAQLLTVQANPVVATAPPAAGTPIPDGPTDMSPRQTAFPTLTAPFTPTWPPTLLPTPSEQPPSPPPDIATPILAAIPAREVKTEDDDYFVVENNSLTVSAGEGVLENDAASSAGQLSVANFSQPAHGAVTMNGDGSFTYTPPPNFFGRDSFTYQACDTAQICALGRVHITVYSALFAVDTVVTFDEDEAIRDITAELLRNDGDRENTPIFIIAVHDADPSRVIFNQGRGIVQYDPGDYFTYLAAGETMTETFQYTIQNSHQLTSTATVTVSIQGKNNPPLARDNQFTLQADRLSAPLQADMLANDFDPDLSDRPQLVVAAVHNSDAGGMATLDNGEVRYDPRGIYESLSPGQTVTDSFTYTIVDPQGAISNVATVHLTIQGVNDPPRLTISNPARPVTFTATLSNSVAIAEMVEIVDPDSQRMARIEIQFSGANPRPDAGDEYLQITFEGDVITSIGDYITILSVPLALEKFVDALQSTVYVNNKAEPTAGCRQIEFQVFDDGDRGSNIETVHIQVNGGVCALPPAASWPPAVMMPPMAWYSYPEKIFPPGLGDEEILSPGLIPNSLIPANSFPGNNITVLIYALKETPW